MAVYGYARVSTATQVDMFGLDRQRHAIKDYCQAHGLALAQIYEDAGISGNIGPASGEEALTRFHGMLGMLATLEEGDTVVVLNTSRLWRSDMAKVLVRRELIKAKANLVAIEQPKYDLNATDPGEYLANAIMEVLDVYDRMKVVRQMSEGMAAKARAGLKPAGLTPYGYRYSADKKSVEVDPAEAATVRRIFLAAHQGVSLRRIAKALAKDGITTRRGKHWSAQGLSFILGNRFYTGELTHQGRRYQGKHEAIISKVLFGRTQSKLRATTH